MTTIRTKQLVKALTVSAACLLTTNTALAEGLVHTNTSQANAQQIQAQSDAKKINVEWNVLPTVLGYVEGSVAVRINQATAIGVSFGKNTRDTENYNIYNANVTLSYALNGDYMSSGWLLKPFIGMASFEQKYDDMFADANTTKGVTTGLLFTYKWLWDSGLNVQLGFGPQYASVNSDDWGDDDGNSGLLLAGEFGLGYSF